MSKDINIVAVRTNLGLPKRLPVVEWIWSLTSNYQTHTTVSSNLLGTRQIAHVRNCPACLTKVDGYIQLYAWGLLLPLKLKKSPSWLLGRC